MTTRPLQTFGAEDWPQRIWYSLAAAACLAYLLSHVWSDWRTLTSWKPLLVFLGLAVASFIVAWGAAVVLAPVVIAPIYLFQASRNGAPFQPGDEVRILAGPAKGRIVRVYSRWQGNSVRVDLSDAARESLKDIYGAHQLQRVEAGD